MSRIFFFICMMFLLSFSAVAQDKKVGPLLDGTSVDYVYETFGAAHVEFSNGQYYWQWTAGPAKGGKGSAPYQARKIGPKTYMVSFKVSGSSNFVTIIFDFDKKALYTSALLFPKTKDEQVLFESGEIRRLRLNEN
jgi:hypothetical protein